VTAYWDNIGKPAAFVQVLDGSHADAFTTHHILTWHLNPVLRGIENIAKERPSFIGLFKEYASNGFIRASSSLKAMAAYVFLHGTENGSAQEPEAIGLFTERLFKYLADNNENGAPNARAYHLYTCAAQIGPAFTDSSSLGNVRRAELTKIWPTVISKATEGNHRTAFPYALYALNSGACTVSTHNEILGVMIKRARQVTEHNKDNPEALTSTLTALERASATLTQEHTKHAESLQGGWTQTFDTLYRHDAHLGISWARDVVESSQPLHPLIRQAAIHATQTCKVPVQPSNVIAIAGGLAPCV